MISDACCDFETVEKINNDLTPRLRELSKTNFFKYYKVSKITTGYIRQGLLLTNLW